MREKKDWTHLSCKLDVKVAALIQEIIDETSLSKTAVIERAIREYHERFKKTGRV